LAFHKAMATFFSLEKCLDKFFSMESMLLERLLKVNWVRYVNIAVKTRKNQFWMSELFEFISIEYSFREINFRGIQLLGVSQEHNFHRPVSRPLAVLH
jgi:hypothetical protein